jgi:hypothetical protein
MTNNRLIMLRGLALLLFFASSLLSLYQKEYANWALYLCLGFMVNAARSEM